MRLLYELIFADNYLVVIVFISTLLLVFLLEYCSPKFRRIVLKLTGVNVCEKYLPFLKIFWPLQK